MDNFSKISSNVRKFDSSKRPEYGDKRRLWHSEFVDYMYKIVEHPNYAGMPGATDAEGKIDWTIPSNRKPGSKNWNGNSQRRSWWKHKALSLGIPVEGKWLSITAKKIHPFGEKPCQTCGVPAEISFVYPGAVLKKKIVGITKNVNFFNQEKLQTIDLVILKLSQELSQKVFEDFIRNEFPLIINSEDFTFSNPVEITKLVRRRYCESESKKFSPGAMANPPDRLDGFHTYNLCCRSKQDTGRSIENLKSYTVDRRAFEFWSSGDWVAADLAMSLAGEGSCGNCAKNGKISPDHVGPISLGFAHTPYFKPLCVACNSSKGNRMSIKDVKELLRLEELNQVVVSPQLLYLWDKVKGKIHNDDHAVLASKLFRINQDHFFKLLYKSLYENIPDQIMNFLPLNFSEYRVEFINFNKSTLQFDGIERVKRQDGYAKTKAARMVRVAFESLLKYSSASSRNIQTIEEKFFRKFSQDLDKVIRLEKKKPDTALRKSLNLAMSQKFTEWNDSDFKNSLELWQYRDNSQVENSTLSAMKEIAKVLDDRFDRGLNVSWGD